MSTQSEGTTAQESVQFAASTIDAFLPDADSGSAARGAQFGAALGRQIEKAAVWALSYLTLSVEVLLRSNLGERYLTPFRCFVVAGGMGAWFMLMSMFSLFGSRNAFLLANRLGVAALAYLMILAALAWQMYQIHKRKRNKIRLHSRYSGDSWPLLRRLPALDAIGGHAGIQYYLEPAILCAAGIATGILPFTAALSTWLFYSGLALAIKGAIQRSHIEGQVLDSIDRTIEADALGALITEWKDMGSKTTWGYVVPFYMKAASQQERIAFATSSMKLHPRLQEILKTPDSGEDGAALT